MGPAAPATRRKREKPKENAESIFNPCCQSNVLIDCIRKKSKCGADVVIDLIDLNGHVRDLPGRTGDRASVFLDGRQTYILIKVEQQEGDLPTKYTSLLNGIEDYHPDLQAKLYSLSQGPMKEEPPQPIKKSKWNAMKTKITITNALSRGRGSKSSRSSMS